MVSRRCRTYDHNHWSLAEVFLEGDRDIEYTVAFFAFSANCASFCCCHGWAFFAKHGSHGKTHLQSFFYFICLTLTGSVLLGFGVTNIVI